MSPSTRILTIVATDLTHSERPFTAPELLARGVTAARRLYGTVSEHTALREARRALSAAPGIAPGSNQGAYRAALRQALS